MFEKHWRSYQRKMKAFFSDSTGIREQGRAVHGATQHWNPHHVNFVERGEKTQNLLPCTHVEAVLTGTAESPWPSVNLPTLFSPLTRSLTKGTFFCVPATHQVLWQALARDKGPYPQVAYCLVEGDRHANRYLWYSGTGVHPSVSSVLWDPRRRHYGMSWGVKEGFVEKAVFKVWIGTYCARAPESLVAFRQWPAVWRLQRQQRNTRCGWCLGLEGRGVRSSLFPGRTSQMPKCQSLMGWAAGRCRGIGSGQEWSTGSASSGPLGFDHLQA